MKNLTSMIILLIASVGFSQTIFDFEGAPPAFGDFNGSSTQVIGNPDPTGVNTTANVAENTVPANAAFAGVNIPTSVIDLTVNKGFTMHVWSPLVNTPVLLKLESTTGPPHERLVNLTTTGAWEEVTFDFSALTNETFDSVTVFMNFNMVDPGQQIYYWDNLVQINLPSPPPSLPITLEGGQLPAFGDFNGSFTQVIANPDPTGVNTTANVAENTVPANAAFAGVNFPVSVIDLSTDKGFTMDVWSPLANTPVLLKLESTTGPPHERLVNLTTTGAWEEVTFDFSALTTETFDSVTVFMNFNMVDPGQQIYYWDNLEQISLAPPNPSLPITFEAGQLPAFGDFNGSFTQVIANPDPTGVNTTANVAENTVPANAAFAGVNFPVSVIDLSTDKGFTMDVWSPLANTPVLLKLESTTGPPHERLVNLTTTGAWEEVTFDFSALTTETFDSVTVFMNFNQTDPSTQIYYWDNLEQISLAPPNPSLPITFEAGQLPAFGDFNGSFTQVIANPDPTGVNTSANVAENTVPANAAFAGVNFPVSVIDLTTDKGFTMDVWSPLANTPVLLKLESTTGPPHERLVNLTTTGAWEEVTFDFSALTTETFDSVTVFMNFNQTDPSTQIYFWDNLEQISLAPPNPSLPITFEAGQLPVFGDFNGSFTQVIANPDPTGVNTTANVAENTVPANAAFAGVNFPVSVIDLTTDKGFTMDVWSPLANTPVLLKLESTTGPPHERLVNLTTSGAWEEVTFDFSALTNETFDSVTVFMNFNQTDPSTQIYYWDNLEQISLAPSNPSLPITFEAGQLPVFLDFGGSITQVIANPDPTGLNTSANVAENTMPANTGGGMNFPVSVIDLSTDKGFIMDVWSPGANTPVLLKLESTTGPPHERLVNLTTTGAWEELTFDFSTLTNETFDSVTIFMNFGQTDPATQVYYWDNLEQINIGSNPVALPLTFETVIPPFNDFNGSFTQVIPNPDPSGVNTSANVAENTVAANAAFAGVNIAVPVDITTDKFFTMDVWSPLVNTPTLLKLENSVTGVNVEREVSLSMTSAWEELTFDFSSEGALTFDSVTVFMNFNMVDPNTQIYYWDNLEQINAASGPANDLCANAIAISCGEIIAGTTIDATDDSATAPVCDTSVTAPGVWYVYDDTSGLASEITITMCNGTTDYDAKLSVYTGDCGAPPLTCVVGNDDTCGLLSEVTFESDGSTTFYILVHGFAANVGNFEIEMNCVLLPPPNDLIANAIDLSNETFPYTDPSVVMIAATVEAGNPEGCDISGANGVWYKGTIPQDGIVTASIVTPAGASSVTFYDAPNLNAIETDLVLVDWYQNQCLPGTTATIPVIAGNSYYAFVLNSGAITDIQIDYTPTLGLNENELEGLTYYPNPTDGMVNLSSIEDMNGIYVYNLLGQKVLDAMPNQKNYSLDVAHLESGIYLVNVMTDVGNKVIRLIRK